MLLRRPLPAILGTALIVVSGALWDGDGAPGESLLQFAGGGRAWADSSVSAAGMVSAGFTDNILGVPATDDPTASQIEADGFSQVSPSVNVNYDARRAIHNLRYLILARFYFTHSEANAFNNQLDYSGLFYTSPLATVGAQASVASGQANSFDRQNSAFVDPVADVPAGEVTFVSGTAGLTYGRRLAPDWNWASGTGVSAYHRTDMSVGTNYMATARTSLQRGFRYHMLSANLGLRYNDNARLGAIENQQTLAIQPELRWTWDMSEHLATSAASGLAVVLEAPELQRGIVLPTGQLALNVRAGEGSATASWTHGVSSNIFTSDVTVSDAYVISGALPLWFSRRVVAVGSGGYRSGRFVNIVEQELTGRTQQLSADFGLAYQYSPSWLISGRYQLVRQRRENPTTGELSSLARRTFFVSLTGRFPTRQAATIPGDGFRTDENYDQLDDSAPAADPR